MTLWEFLAARDGCLLAQGVKPAAPEISDERLSELGITGF